ncbi:invasion associated locus B family protein [Neorhizobium sp. JUb45]|uniref:invasion associated locus B family protein n=1 Tax=Neorhizobium sp. JUb45 TaxID=2485113 RepID=UPI0010429F7A|nr:invasion associated locus B family protein [Neorhizobium sp. JUb45]TCQ99382.1 invasion protein IalB [Neorhizobium sp. JUb45]
MAEQPAPDGAKIAHAVERFGAWNVRCTDTQGATAKQCEVVQVATIKQADQDVTIMTFAVAPAAAVKGANEPAHSLTMLVPLNVLLSAGLSISVDDKPAAKLSYRNCNQSGCWVQSPLNTALLAQLSKGRSGSAKLDLVNGQTVNIRFSLDGLTAAMKKLNAAS